MMKTLMVIQKKILLVVLFLFYSGTVYADGWYTGKVYSIMAVPENHHGLVEWRNKVQFVLTGGQVGNCPTIQEYGNNTLFWIEHHDVAALSLLMMAKSQDLNVTIYYANDAPKIQGYCAVSIVRID